MTKRRDWTLQDDVEVIGQDEERPSGRNLESRNPEKVTKSTDALQDQVGQEKDKRQPGARKSVQFSDALVDNLG